MGAEEKGVNIGLDVPVKDALGVYGVSEYSRIRAKPADVYRSEELILS